jgi:hypothetical protein
MTEVGRIAGVKEKYDFSGQLVTENLLSDRSWIYSAVY